MPKALQHILVWLGIGLFFFALIAGFGAMRFAAIKFPVLLLTIAAAFYINTLYLLPQFYGKGKLGLFLSLNVVLVVGLTGASFYLTGYLNHLEILPGELFGDPVRRPGRPGRPPRGGRGGPFPEVLIQHVMPVCLGVLAGAIFHIQQLRRLAEKRRSESRKVENEFLISQINPHFLFNALNNIYAMTIGDTESGKAILQLSEILSYSIYKGREDFVRLEEEIDYMGNYIELFKLKDDAMDNIEFDWEDADPNFKIAPLLLLPFLENAFKHGNVEEIQGAWVKIRVATEGNQLTMECENTIGEFPKHKDKVGGIGIQNIRRRLELNYKGNFSLRIEETPSLYKVNLSLKHHGG